MPKLFFLKIVIPVLVIFCSFCVFGREVYRTADSIFKIEVTAPNIMANGFVHLSKVRDEFKVESDSEEPLFLLYPLRDGFEWKKYFELGLIVAYKISQNDIYSFEPSSNGWKPYPNGSFSAEYLQDAGEDVTANYSGNGSNVKIYLNRILYHSKIEHIVLRVTKKNRQFSYEILSHPFTSAKFISSKNVVFLDEKLNKADFLIFKKLNSEIIQFLKPLPENYFPMGMISKTKSRNFICEIFQSPTNNDFCSYPLSIKTGVYDLKHFGLIDQNQYHKVMPNNVNPPNKQNVYLPYWFNNQLSFLNLEVRWMKNDKFVPLDSMINSDETNTQNHLGISSLVLLAVLIFNLMFLKVLLFLTKRSSTIKNAILYSLGGIVLDVVFLAGGYLLSRDDNAFGWSLLLSAGYIAVKVFAYFHLLKLSDHKLVYKICYVFLILFVCLLWFCFLSFVGFWIAGAPASY